MQDILNTDHASKVEEHDQYNVIIAKQIMGGEAMQVSLVQGAEFVLTFQEQINSRCPRPIGIMASIAFSPVCSGSVTG